jgi:PAS domain S-box-containing protein
MGKGTDAARPERDHARQGRRESDEGLGRLIRNAPIGIAEIDLDGIFLDANPMACELLQYSRHELAGMSSVDLVAPRFRDSGDEALKQLLEGARQSTTYETAFVRRDGTEREAEVIATVLRDTNGKASSILALIQDVTERRRLEARVMAQAELIDNAHDAIFVKQLGDSTINFWNPAAAGLYGYSEVEALGRISHDLLRTEFPEPLEDIEATLTRTGGWSGELLHLTSASEAVWVDSRWVLIRDGAGLPAAVLEISRDVSQERHLADERERLMAILEQQNRELRESDRLKTEFLLTISHELRTPLTAIVGFSDLLALDSPLAERSELEVIQRNGRRLLSIIEDILTVARVQAGEVRLRPRPVDVAGVVRRVVAEHHLLAREKGLDLRLEGETSAWAVADETATSHSTRQLVDNAIKFTSAGTVTVRIDASPEEVRIQVEDTGIGIPSEARDLIFDDFRQVDQSITRAYGGVGIGLAVVRRLVGLQGGRLGFDDRPGGGSIFWFTLPAGEAGPADLA